MQITIIIIFIIAAYINTLNNDFVWDDKTFTLEWKTKNDISNIPKLLKGELPEEHKGVYRPFRSILNRNAILAKSIFDLDVIASFTFLAAILIIAFFTFKKQPLVTFCIGWFFITLLPVSNI